MAAIIASPHAVSKAKMRPRRRIFGTGSFKQADYYKLTPGILTAAVITSSTATFVVNSFVLSISITPISSLYQLNIDFSTKPAQ